MADFYCSECDLFFSDAVLMEQHDCEEEASRSGTSYCCGQMYEDGEIFCKSCGDPL